MATQRKTKPVGIVKEKARRVLAFAEEKALEVPYGMDLFNAIFGPDGKATLLFPAESERTAFTRTAECKRIHALINTLPSPPVRDMGDLLDPANGILSIQIP